MLEMMKDYIAMPNVNDIIAMENIPHFRQGIQDCVVISNEKETNQNIEKMENEAEREEERKKEVCMWMLNNLLC